MSDAAMVILWPSSTNSSNWVVSHRVAGGHAVPDFNPAVTSSTPGRWEVVPSLRSSSSSSYSSSSFSTTTVTLVRALSLPSNQAVYPSSRTKYANLQRKTKQHLIYAASSHRPVSDSEGASLSMHTGGMYGATTVDLSRNWIREKAKSTTKKKGGATKTSGVAGAEAMGTTAERQSESVDDGEADDLTINEADGGKVLTSTWTQHDYLIFAHVVFAFLAWLLVAPAGVLLARFGRKWSHWYEWHSSIHLYLTTPFTLFVLALGIAAAAKSGTATALDSHKTLGCLTLVLLLFQLAMGYLSHSTPFVATRTSTRPGVRVVHIISGIALLGVAWATMGTGLSEWTSSAVSTEGRRAMRALFAVGITLSLLPFLFSLLTLIRLRRREGRSFLNAFFGLGRYSAAANTHIGRSWAIVTPSTTSESEGSGDELGYGGGARVAGSGRKEGELALRKEVWDARVQSRWSC